MNTLDDDDSGPVDEYGRPLDFLELIKEYDEKKAKGLPFYDSTLPSVLTRRPHAPTKFNPGNRTRGAGRRGNTKGRPRIHDKPWDILIRMDDKVVAQALYLGEGNITAGIRRALAALATHFEAGLPTERYEMKTYIEEHEPNVAYAVTRILANVIRRPKPVAPPPDPADDWDDVS